MTRVESQLRRSLADSRTFASSELPAEAACPSAFQVALFLSASHAHRRAAQGCIELPRVTCPRAAPLAGLR